MENAEKRFHELLLIFSTNTKIVLTPMHFHVYDDALIEHGISYAEACAALNTLMRTTKAWTMPTPGLVIETARPKLGTVSEANNIAGMIIQAVRDHGYSNERLARNQVGELAWKVVNRFGGWNHVCTGDHDHGQLRAQLRDCAAAMIETGKVRDVDAPPQLEGPVASSIRLIAQGREMP